MDTGLFAPLRTAATWRTLVYLVTDFPIGMAFFVPTVWLSVATAALLLPLPLAVIPATLLFALTRLFGHVERNRLWALHRVGLADPVPPIGPGRWWERLRRVLTSLPRWKGIAYCLLRLPVSVLFTPTAVLLWSGSAALTFLPVYLWAMPDDTARFGLFSVSSLRTAIVVGLVGLVGLLVAAPWTTVLLGRLDVGLARWLLGPDQGAELAARATSAETHRAAAVETAETERRRIERDLHDGAQQRLVALAMDLGAARERLETDPEAGKQLVAEAHEEAKAALREIRDLVRGIHPVILEDRGLDAALSAVVARSPTPVRLQIDVDQRPPAAVESAAYFVVSEALANVARHARATKATVAIAERGGRLIVEVRDNGIGGADPDRGTGLNGLAERVAGMGGTMDVLSPLGGPSTLLVEIPCAF